MQLQLSSHPLPQSSTSDWSIWGGTARARPFRRKCKSSPAPIPGHFSFALAPGHAHFLHLALPATSQQPFLSPFLDGWREGGRAPDVAQGILLALSSHSWRCMGNLTTLGSSSWVLPNPSSRRCLSAHSALHFSHANCTFQAQVSESIWDVEGKDSVESN